MINKFRILSILIAVLFSVSLLSLASCSHEEHNKVSKTYTLAPKAKKRIKFKAKHETNIGFTANLSSEQKDKCKKGGIRMSHVDSQGNGEALSSCSNARMDVVPEKGKISFTLENKELFPIKVFVSWRS